MICSKKSVAFRYTACHAQKWDEWTEEEREQNYRLPVSRGGNVGGRVSGLWTNELFRKEVFDKTAEKLTEVREAQKYVSRHDLLLTLKNKTIQYNKAVENMREAVGQDIERLEVERIEAGDDAARAEVIWVAN